MVQIDEGIILIICSSLLASSAYALIAPFFPLELEEKGVDEKYIGMIFSIYSIAVIIFSPPVGRCLEFVGYSNMLLSGLTLMGVDFVLLRIRALTRKKLLLVSLSIGHWHLHLTLTLITGTAH